MPYMQRAGIRSNRELSALTGIKHATLDQIVKYPARARGYQLAIIADVCGMSDSEMADVIRRRG
jgi:hypothetical protein